MTTYTTIDQDNAEAFIGSEVRFEYGPMHGSERGWIVGAETTRWGTHLIAMTSEGEHRAINGFSTVGIGVYLK